MATAFSSARESACTSTSKSEDLLKELNFSAILVESREHAFKSLRKVYEAATQPRPKKKASHLQERSRPSNMILLTGLSGTGKSMLVQDLFFNEVKM